ncbi:Plug domain-containing protein [Helicobacter saguini]|uniref:Plug domain-containing protein n=1 Tax=Helicobacter saguini TaxID=1548018 RepID=A0A4V6YS89_9HELI|nr:Plug domain-containing protein [Helicobacter saguini]
MYIYIYITIFFSFNVLDSKESIESKALQDSKATIEEKDSNATQNTQIDSNNTNKTYKLNAITAFSDNDLNKFQSSPAVINRQIIESNPSGNGDIGSLLRILPNVQFDNSQLSSNTPGEISPANISISGGLHYQNLFMLDGMNINNDLGAGYNNLAGGNRLNTGTASQGLAIDTSLLDSITLQDSNISASFGGFNGGVIEATTRRPTKKFGAKISYQITQGNATPKAISMTNYYLLDSNLQDFLISTSSSNQPQFIKHLVKSSIESKINDNFGILAAFNTTQSFIPLRRGARNSNNLFQTPADPQDYADMQTQKRQIYNAFFKAYYSAT